MPIRNKRTCVPSRLKDREHVLVSADLVHSISSNTNEGAGGTDDIPED